MTFECTQKNGEKVIVLNRKLTRQYTILITIFALFIVLIAEVPSRLMAQNNSEIGPLIAYSSPGDNGLSIWIANHDGSNKRQLTNGPIDVLPMWSPDGQQIAFLQIPQDTDEDFFHGDLAIIGTMTNVLPQKLVMSDESGEVLFEPQWSPDGTHIAYLWGRWQEIQQQSPANANPSLASIEVRVIRVEDGRIQSLATTVGVSPTFTWSPDSNKIALLSWEINSDSPSILANLEIIEIESGNHQILPLGDKIPFMVQELSWLTNGLISTISATPDNQIQALLINPDERQIVQTIPLDYLQPSKMRLDDENNLLVGGGSIWNSLMAIGPGSYDPNLPMPSAAYVRYQLNQLGSSSYCGTSSLAGSRPYHFSLGLQSLSDDGRYCAAISPNTISSFVKMNGEDQEYYTIDGPIEVYVEDSNTHEQWFIDVGKKSLELIPLVSFQPIGKTNSSTSTNSEDIIISTPTAERMSEETALVPENILEEVEPVPTSIPSIASPPDNNLITIIIFTVVITVSIIVVLVGGGLILWWVLRRS